ncbi:putative lipid II flippase FtsW [bacterium]|uniref:Probable peptidoglycan glycosyltransferase FtsW n=2 Tax=Katanobacteria TaxID=422282 RepID=A0A2M7X540_UNCKA|nr:putative lipid II flippase FtsW [bacterium]PIP56385.1 MAG: putative lipid II flippase FtsW [candidate division WWE3 bacterium CG22_combo_CG10-13_8_21_14_all_39_12]PJA41285.1 MAG: putative lipid II flippase FtsW [candidate division WWE3 bacterium CG_4_9_14_3_um_filter_39_7]
MPVRSKKNSFKIRTFAVTDYVLAGVVLALTLFGVFMVYNTSVVVAFEEFGDKFWFLKNQSIWAFIGIVGAFIVSNIDYHVLKKIAFPLIVLTIILLLVVLLPGFSQEVYGAKQRLYIPVPFLQSISVQPSEIAKLSIVIYLAALFDKDIRRGLPHKPFLVVVGTILLLTALEPDLGNAILISVTALMVYFVAGASLFWISLAGISGAVSAVIYALSSDYRRQRIFTFLDPLADPQGVSYQITQIFIALGSGGILGLGLGSSRQKYEYIPEVTTDSIFAIIGEELGFIGAILVIGALAFVIWRGITIAQRASDPFGKFLAVGITTTIAFQTLVNLGGMVGLMPLTGVPLPFISYGGTSLTLLLVSVGILINISRSARGQV